VKFMPTKSGDKMSPLEEEAYGQFNICIPHCYEYCVDNLELLEGALESTHTCIK
jgi:hypothetical protein